MKSNYDRPKTISRKTTKNYHPRADYPRILKLCRHISIEALKRGRKAIDYLCIFYTENMPYTANWSIIFVVYP